MTEKIPIKVGDRFGRLFVVSNPIRRNNAMVYECVCDCGNVSYVARNNLKSGNTKSCGCYKAFMTGKRSRTHGKSQTLLHHKWRGMKDRCFNPNNIEFKNYGGRGITVYPEWVHDFSAFYKWSMKNGYKESLSIDRIDVNGNYEPSNCRWVDRDVQSNNKRTSFLITYNGQTLTVTQWSKIVGIDRRTIADRIKRFGWSAEAALNVKPKKTYEHKRDRGHKTTV